MSYSIVIATKTFSLLVFIPLFTITTEYLIYKYHISGSRTFKKVTLFYILDNENKSKLIQKHYSQIRFRRISQDNQESSCSIVRCLTTLETAVTVSKLRSWARLTNISSMLIGKFNPYTTGKSYTKVHAKRVKERKLFF